MTIVGHEFCRSLTVVRNFVVGNVVVGADEGVTRSVVDVRDDDVGVADTVEDPVGVVALVEVVLGRVVGVAKRVVVVFTLSISGMLP